MAHGRKMTGLSLVAGAAAVAGLMTSPAVAQEDVPDVNQGALSLEVGADVVTEYWFRGLEQQNKGFIFQPFSTLTAEMPEIAGMRSQVYVGTWNSFHDRSVGEGAPRGKWFEADFTAGVVVELMEGLTGEIAYTNYRFPDVSDSGIQELAVGVAYDDTAMMEDFGIPFGLNPHALLAFEIQGNGTGDSRGTYLELGVTPTFDLVPDGDFPVTLSVPAVVGLNIDNYYQDDMGDDGTFGFVDVGVRAGVPLAFIPREYGDWTASAGVHANYLGQSTKRLSIGDENFNVYGTVGFSVNY